MKKRAMIVGVGILVASNFLPVMTEAATLLTHEDGVSLTEKVARTATTATTAPERLAGELSLPIKTGSSIARSSSTETSSTSETTTDSETVVTTPETSSTSAINTPETSDSATSIEKASKVIVNTQPVVDQKATKKDKVQVTYPKVINWEGLELTLTADGTLIIPAGTINSPGMIKAEFARLSLPYTLVKKIIIEGPLVIIGDSSGIFWGFSAMTEIAGFNQVDTSQATDLGALFRECASLTSIDLSALNTSQVEDMSTMFDGCSSLKALDLSKFDTSQVTSMWGMFAGDKALTTLDLSAFNTGNVTLMHDMFIGCSGLTSLQVGSFDTSKVTSMYAMFSGCSGLTQLDITNFNTSQVYDMESMFYECSGLQSLDLHSFNTEKVTDMANMFNKCSGLTALDLSMFETSSVKRMSGMFVLSDKLKRLNLSSFNMSQVIDMFQMFAFADNLQEVTFGPNFHFNKRLNGQVTEADLTEASSTAPYDGYWQNVGSGTVEKPQGKHILTAVDLMTTYDGAIDADTYVWHRAVSVAGDITVHYQDLQGGALAKDDVLSGQVGDTYQTEAKKITGYTLVNVDGNRTGTFSDKAQTVTYRYERAAGAPVMVSYEDEQGTEIAPAETLNGQLGASYVTTAKKISGYTLQTEPLNATGTFSATAQSVIYLYTKDSVKGADVTVSYQDESGQTLAPDKIMSGDIGTAFTSEQLTIEGYTLKEVQGAASGEISATAQRVVYIYTKESDAIVTPAPTPTPGSTLTPGKTVPAGAKVTHKNTGQNLPQTGDQTSLLLTMLGGVVILVGFMLRKWKWRLK